jgi:hypothetical protein
MRKINPIKNQKIKAERGASFEEVVTDGVLLDVRQNPKYPDQFIEVYFFDNYVWAVITGEDPSRFITMYKCKKLKKEFGL